jgi:hypothetical protein
MQERWVEIPGFPLYSISDHGVVSARHRSVHPYVDPQGHVRVSFGQGYHRRVADIVAEAFCGKPRNDATAIHKDGNRLNNHASNLTWRQK